MPLREPQASHSSETLRRLQRFVQLSDTPLVRFFTVTLIRYQLWMMGNLFGVMLISIIQHLAPFLMIKSRVAIEFFSAVSQSLAALLGILIAFLTVTSQFIAQHRLDYYQSSSDLPR